MSEVQERTRRRSAKPARETGPSLIPIPRRLENPFPPLEVLTEDAIETVLDAAFQILEEGGLEFRSERALDLLQKNGATVDRSTKMVRMGRDMVQHFCCMAPSAFALHSRNPEKV